MPIEHPYLLELQANHYIELSPSPRLPYCSDAHGTDQTRGRERFADSLRRGSRRGSQDVPHLHGGRIVSLLAAGFSLSLGNDLPHFEEGASYSLRVVFLSALWT